MIDALFATMPTNRRYPSAKPSDSGIFLTTKDTNDPKKFHGMDNAFPQSRPLPMKFFRVVSCFSLFKKNSSVTQVHLRITHWPPCILYGLVFLLCAGLLLSGCRKAAQIHIDSIPAGAALWEEDELLGHTPILLPLPEGASRTLILRQPGCQEVKLILDPPLNNRDQEILVELSELAEKTYRLACSSSPDGAEFFLNNEFKGRTPVEISGLSGGQYEFMLRHKEREEVRKTLFLSEQSPDRTVVHIKLPSQLVAFYSKQIVAEPANLHHYADLGHQLILEGELVEAISTFRKGLQLSLSGKGAGDDHRLWSEIERVISKQYDYGSEEIVRQANETLLQMLRELKKEFPAPDSIAFYIQYATCADKLNFRQEAQDLFDEAWAKWPDNRTLVQMKKRYRF